MRRCYAYELAMEYFSLLEPDCYELCSYCESIPEFLEEKNESCLTRAIGAVKVFVNRCVEAPSIARAVVRTIVEKIFFSASTRIREMATDIILDFIEWEAGNAVLKELIAGALKYDGVRSDECIRVMRYALLDFGPHVISVYKLIDFIALLVRDKSFFSINDECSQLLIVIYKCLGWQVRVHLAEILDPNYISAIEESYEEMRNIPIYHCRFVRYSKDNASSLKGSDEEIFAACRIAEPTSHTRADSSNYENGEIVEAEQSRMRNSGREPYIRGGVAGPSNDEYKEYWCQWRNMINYEEDYGVGGPNEHQANQAQPNAYENAIAYDMFDCLNHAGSIADFFRPFPNLPPEPKQQGYRWNLDNFEQLHDHHISPRSIEDRECQTDGDSKHKYFNPFEAALTKLMDKHGTKNTLDWLYWKLNSNSIKPLNDEGTKQSSRIHVPLKCYSLGDITKIKQQSQNLAKSSASDTDISLRFLQMQCLNVSRKFSSYPISVTGKNENKMLIVNKHVSSLEKQSIKSLQDLENNKDNFLVEPIKSFETSILSEEYLRKIAIEETNENIMVVDKNKSQMRIRKHSLVRKIFQKIPFISSKIQKKGCSASDRKFFSINSKNQNDQLDFHTYLNDDHKTNHVNRDFEPNKLPSKNEYRDSLFDIHTRNYRNNYTIYRCTNFPSQCPDHTDGSQTLSNHNLGQAGFNANEQVDRSEDFQPPSVTSKENIDEDMIYLSESDSMSEISPNLCCYYFQKNSNRKLAPKKGEGNQQDYKTTLKTDQEKQEEGIAQVYSGPVKKRRNQNNPFRVTSEVAQVEVVPSRHRGGGDEPPQPASMSSKSRRNWLRRKRL